MKNSTFAVGGAASQLAIDGMFAAAGGSLAALRWLAVDNYCAISGPDALSLGRPRKSVLRVAIEQSAVDVMQWLLCAEAAPPLLLNLARRIAAGAAARARR